MKTNFPGMLNRSSLLKINVISVIVIAFCEFFVVYTFLTKGMTESIEPWKFKIILIGMIIVSLLFLASIASFVYFFFSGKKS